MKRESTITLITDEDILHAYWGGGKSIDRIARYVAGNERITKSEAKERVECVVYKNIMEDPEYARRSD